MKTIQSATQQIHGDSTDLTLRYLLYLDRDPQNTDAYGIQIRNETTRETSNAPSLTTDYDLASSFYRRLVRGQVTPVSLAELIEDFLAEI